MIIFSVHTSLKISHCSGHEKKDFSLRILILRHTNQMFMAYKNKIKVLKS